MNGASTKQRRGHQADGSYLSIGSNDPSLKGGVGEPLPLLSLADFPLLVAREKRVAPTRAAARVVERKRQQDAAVRIMKEDGEMALAASSPLEVETKRPRRKGPKKAPRSAELTPMSVIDARREARRRR